MIKLYRGENSIVLEREDRCCECHDFSIDALFHQSDPHNWLSSVFEDQPPCDLANLPDCPWLAPVENQEIWAAGVTYYRSREARMEEAEAAGGDRFYDLVYDAERPELFFKATARRCRGHLDSIRIRADSDWDVPEPEFTLAINRKGKIFGCTIGNDVSSRTIEGENPLYLPQAKVYTGSCAMGPALLVGDPVDTSTPVELRIKRGDNEVFAGDTSLSQLKRGREELASFLFRENDFPDGCYLMTGTGIVPDAPFTLQSGDIVAITIPPVGTLKNTVG